MSRWMFWRKSDSPKSADEAFVADIPIKYAKEDLLGRTAFAKALAKVIFNHRSDESLVLACAGNGVPVSPR
jgi:hypothetical protein